MSPATRFEALDWKATYRPSALIADSMLASLACVPSLATLTRSVTPTAPAGDATINPHLHVNRRHATVMGCWGYEFTHLYRSVRLMAKHHARIPWARLVTREYRLDRAAEALEAMARLEVVKAVVRP